MAVKTSESVSGPTHAGRKWAVGANVTIAVVAAIALAVAINWIASLRYIRRDLATLDNYGASERTQRILAEIPGDVTISVVYAPNPKDKKQQQYIDRLLDYGDELHTLSKQVTVRHVATAREREELAANINQAFGGEADKHQAALAAFETVRSAITTELKRFASESEPLMQGQSWISDFPIFAQVLLKLRDVEKDLTDAADEIKALTSKDNIPKYGEATNRAKKSVEDVSKALDNIATLLSELTRLADDVTAADSANVKMLREVAGAAKEQIHSLRATVGEDGDPPPADIAAALKAYADRSVQVGPAISAAVERVDAFSKQFPIVRQHANWSTRVQSGPLVMQLEVADVLDDMGQSLGKTRLQLLGVIDGGDAERLQKSLTVTRKNTSAMEKNAAVCEQLLTELSERLSNVDEGSKRILDAARGNTLFMAQTEEVKKVEAQFKDLPELKLGSVADKLSEDNSVVIQFNKKIRVVDFATVWPVRESIPGANQDDKEQQRTFNGDSAISSAILALKADKPFAAVTFVSFEPPAPQQRNPFMPPPPQSSLPAGELSEARQRLEAANFKVYDWNLATTKERPKIEDGLNDILFVLPPAPASQPNPFGGQQPDEPKFGDEQRNAIRALLDGGSRALFAGTWEVVSGGMMSNRWMSPAYGWESLLEQDWGLRLDNGLRVLAVEPDVRTPNGFSIGVRKFTFMPLTGFTDHPIGKPMIGTRFFADQCARVERLANPPKGVTTEAVVSVPKRDDYIGVTINELIEIINYINDPKSEGVVQMQTPPMHGPFDLMVTSTRVGDDGKTRGKVALLGFGRSLVDSYVKQRMLVDTERARSAPEPKESLDLLVNTFYWLNDADGYIGRGPVPVPRVRSMTESEQQMTRWFVWLIWPGIVVAPGIVLWFMRRR